MFISLYLKVISDCIAAEMASDFIQKKYGDRYSAELETVKSSYSFGYGGESLFHSVDGYVLCIKKDDDYSFYDSYQYEEIKAAVGNDIESYFSDHSGKLINSAFAVCEQHYYSDDTNCYMFSSYFDGDIKSSFGQQKNSRNLRTFYSS